MNQSRLSGPVHFVFPLKINNSLWEIKILNYPEAEGEEGYFFSRKTIVINGFEKDVFHVQNLLFSYLASAFCQETEFHKSPNYSYNDFAQSVGRFLGEHYLGIEATALNILRSWDMVLSKYNQNVLN